MCSLLIDEDDVLVAMDGYFKVLIVFDVYLDVALFTRDFPLWLKFTSSIQRFELWNKEDLFALVLQTLCQLLNWAIEHDVCQAMMYADGLFALLGTIGTQIAEIGGNGYLVPIVVAISQGPGTILIQIDAPLPHGIIMLLFAGDDAGAATGAVLVVYQ